MFCRHGNSCCAAINLQPLSIHESKYSVTVLIEGTGEDIQDDQSPLQKVLKLHISIKAVALDMLSANHLQ